MSEAYFCCDEGQYLANKAFFEREHGPQDDKDKRIRNQRHEIECLKNKIKKLERKLDNQKKRIENLQRKAAQ